MLIILSRHAKERMVEFSVTQDEVLEMIRNSTEEKMDKNMRKYKNKKYDESEIYHRRYGTYVFVIAKTINKFNGEPCLLLISLTNQLMNVKKGQWCNID